MTIHIFRKIEKIIRLLFLGIFIFPTLLCELAIAQTGDSLNNDQTGKIISEPDSVATDSLNINLSDELKSKVHYPSFDSIVFAVDEQKVYLYRNALIEYEDIKLRANYIEINWDTQTMFATGGLDSSGKMSGYPEFEQGADKFKSQTMLYNFGTKKGKITQISTQQGEGFIHGDTVRKTPFDDFYIKHGRYTTCDAPDPHFYIGANKLKVIKNDKIVTGPAYLVLEDVPTPLVLPFGFFPNKRGRNSGILIPAYGESAELGFFLKDGGYYFGLSDHFDLSLTGDIYSLGSWALHSTSNYATRYKYKGNFTFNFSNLRTGIPEVPDYKPTRDYRITWTHSQDPKAHPNSNFSANVNFGSSSYYNNNLTTPLNYLSNTFVSSVAYSKSWAGKPYNLTLSGGHNQNTLTKQVSVSIPDLTFGISRLYPLKRKEAVGKERWYEKIGFSYTLNSKNQINTYDSLLFTNSTLDNMKNGMAHAIPFSTSFKVLKYFNLTPSINFSEKWYYKTYQERYDAANDTVLTDTIYKFKAAHEYSASLGLNTRIFGMYKFRKGKLAAIRHVVSPSVSLSYRPDFSASKYNNYKVVQTDAAGSTRTYSVYQNTLYGGPSAGRYGFLSFGVDNSFEMKVRQITDTATNYIKKPLLESFSFNSGYNFAVDSFQWSPINLAARTTVFKVINIIGNMNFDEYALNDSGIRTSQTMWEKERKISRLTNAALNINIPLNTKLFSKEEESIVKEKKNQPQSGMAAIPWDLNLAYTINYRPDDEVEIIQTLNFYGNVSITPLWKINFGSGYDFEQKDISYTTIGFYRDLHCWEMRLNWVPFGAQENYLFQINVKSSVLQDLKFTKRTDIYDN